MSRIETIGDCTLYLGDAREILPSLTFDAVVTDPVWDRAKGIPGAEDPRGLFDSVAADICRARLVALQLGCYCDPCFLAEVAKRLPFIHTCWLSYVPPSYNGRVLVEADVAYVYGTPPASKPGRRVLPSTCRSTHKHDSEAEFLRRHGRNRSHKVSAATTASLSHPMPRRLEHVRWLVKWHTENTDVTVDPFLGSGTTGVACTLLRQKFVGIEINAGFFDVACRRIEQAYKQGVLAFEGAA